MTTAINMNANTAREIALKVQLTAENTEILSTLDLIFAEAEAGHLFKTFEKDLSSVIVDYLRNAKYVVYQHNLIENVTRKPFTTVSWENAATIGFFSKLWTAIFGK